MNHKRTMLKRELKKVKIRKRRRKKIKRRKKLLKKRKEIKLNQMS